MNEFTMIEFQYLVEQGLENWEKMSLERDQIQQSKLIVLCPGGRISKEFLKSYSSQVVAVADKKQNIELDRYKTISYQDAAREFPEATFVITSAMYGREIEGELNYIGVGKIVNYYRFCINFPEYASREYRKMGQSVFSKNTKLSIEKCFNFLEDDLSQKVLLNKIGFYLTGEYSYFDEIYSDKTPYFSNDVIPYSDSTDLIVDLGAFTGDTVEKWLSVGSRNFSKYVAFEPDSKNIEILRSRYGSNLRIVVEHKAIGLSDGIVGFLEEGNTDSKVEALGCHKNQVTVEQVTLDTYFGNESPTIIKMDIEGSEKQAILSGRKVIANTKSKLAISSYHFPSDLWEVPLLLRELRPSSKFYFRHYSREIDDTVCYVLD